MGGFCYLNNSAIAAQYIIDHYNKQVVIIDIDYHHGNGIQKCFYTVNNPTYISLHGSPDYPYFDGSENEKGSGEGYGYNFNVPLPLNTNDDEYISALNDVLNKAVILFYRKFSYIRFLLELVLISPFFMFINLIFWWLH